MTKTLNELEKTILQKRKELIQVVELYGLRSPYVLKESQELDVLLNEYTTLKKDDHIVKGTTRR